MDSTRQHRRQVLSLLIYWGGTFASFTLAAAPAAQAESLAGRTYTLIVNHDFPFDTLYEDFAGLTYNPLTQTFFMTDHKADAIIEMLSNGNLVRAIDIAGLKAAGEPEADAEGITWMYGQKYALVMEGSEEMAIVTITPATTAISRAQAVIYDLSGDPKGVAYKASEDALYWVSEDNPMRVVKSRINPATGNLDTLANIDLSALPATALADIAYFPRLSPHLLFLSHTAKNIMEVNVSGGSPALQTTFSFAPLAIPDAGGLAFAATGNMFVVGKKVSTGPEDDFHVFQPSPAIPNQLPNAVITSFTP